MTEEKAAKLRYTADNDHFYTTVGLTFPSSHQRAIESSQAAYDALQELGQVNLAAFYADRVKYHQKKKSAAERREAKRRA